MHVINNAYICMYVYIAGVWQNGISELVVFSESSINLSAEEP